MVEAFRAAITMNLVKTVQDYNPKLEIGGMFFTQWNGRKNVSKSVYELLEEAFSIHPSSKCRDQQEHRRRITFAGTFISL